MPRSRLQNWASCRRLEYTEDHLIQHGWVNREALQSYFGLERSLGSMDITAYQKAGGLLRKAKAGEVMPDGTIVRGYKLGGRLLYVPAADYAPVLGSTEARRKAWDLLPKGGGSHAAWLASVMAAYVADTGNDAASYFGIGDKEASGIVAGVSDDRRALVWEVWA